MSDLWIWPLVGALFLGLFLAAAVAARPGPAAVRLWLAVLLLTAAAFAGEFAAMRSGLYRHPVVFVTYPLFLVMGPAAWFLSRSLAGAPPGARAMVLHLLPAALMAADLAPYYADIVRSGGQPAHGGRTWLGLGPYAQCLLQLAQTGVYAGAAVLGFRRFERTVRDRHSGGLVPRIACLHRLAASLAAVVAVEFLATLVMMLSGQHVVAAEYGMGFAVAALVIALGWMVVREPAALDAPPPSEARYERSALSAEALSRYGVALVRAVEEHELWRRPDLRSGDLAERAGIPRHHLSQVLRRGFGRSFYDFVNAYRVREAARQLLSDDLGDKTMLAVAYDAGFSSKASFHRVFKELLGATPTEFRARGTLDHPAIRELEPLTGSAP